MSITYNFKGIINTLPTQPKHLARVKQELINAGATIVSVNN